MLSTKASSVRGLGMVSCQLIIPLLWCDDDDNDDLSFMVLNVGLLDEVVIFCLLMFPFRWLAGFGFMVMKPGKIWRSVRSSLSLADRHRASLVPVGFLVWYRCRCRCRCLPPQPPAQITYNALTSSISSLAKVNEALLTGDDNDDDNDGGGARSGNTWSISRPFNQSSTGSVDMCRGQPSPPPKPTPPRRNPGDDNLGRF